MNASIGVRHVLLTFGTSGCFTGWNAQVGFGSELSEAEDALI
jgi:hypothetical protein